MYNEEFENEQDVKSNDNFIVNFYYNNKVLIWILVGVIAFILIMSLLTRGGSSSGTSSKYEVSILPEEAVEISIGNTYPLRAKVDKNANAIIIWSSADENIAKVDNGTVTAVNYGKTTITATYIHNDDTKYTATKEVTVADGNPNLTLTDASFKNGDLLMPVNSTFDIALSLTPSNGYVINKEFTSSKPSVVTVDNKGHVVSVSEGEAIISLNVNNGTIRKTLNVYVSRDYTRSEIVINPEKITFDNELVKMKVGMSQKLRYTLFPVDADSTRLEWISSDEGIIKIEEGGYAKALQEGVATITLRSVTGVNDTMDIEVGSDIIPVTDINLSLNDLYLTVGQVQTITPTVSPANASNKGLSFIPSDTNVVAVNPNNTGTAATIYALSPGQTTITISSVNNVERRLNVVVTNGNSNDNNGGSGGGSSSSSSDGFTMTSKDANWATTHEGFVNNTYEKTINNEATAPVEITVKRTSSSISRLRVAKCLYPYSSCDPSTSSDVYDFTDNTIFTITTPGTYVLRVAKYNSNGTLIGISDRYIAVKGSSGSSSSTCPAGKYSIGNNCYDCTIGYFCYNGDRSACPTGFYQDTRGQSTCKQCPSGYTTSGTGATNSSSCSVYIGSSSGSSGTTPATGKTCPNGEYPVGSSCYPCTVGHYCVNSQIKECAKGTYQNERGKTSCKPCSTATGTGATTCSGGSSGTSPTTPVTGKTCLRGQYLDGTECKPCPPGNKCVNNVKTACPKGTYQDTGSQYDCKNCPSGYTTSGTGSIACNTPASTKQCKSGEYLNGSNCYPCPWGSYCINDVITACKKGTYQDQKGQSSCKPCSTATTTGATTCANSSNGISMTATKYTKSVGLELEIGADKPFTRVYFCIEGSGSSCPKFESNKNQIITSALQITSYFELSELNQYFDVAYFGMAKWTYAYKWAITNRYGIKMGRGQKLYFFVTNYNPGSTVFDYSNVMYATK